MKKKIYMMLTVLFTVMVFAPVVSVDAASVDVTAKMASKKDIKKISKMVAAYTTAMDLSEASATKSVKLQLGDKDKLSLAVFVRYNYKNDYAYTAAELRAETKNLFGKSASVEAIKKAEAQNNTMLVCSADKTFVTEPYMYCGGDFGDVVPAYQIKKIVKTGKKTYTITLQNRVGCYGEKGTTAIGTTTVKVKKSSASKYGYIVKGISYRYNGK